MSSVYAVHPVLRDSPPGWRGTNSANRHPFDPIKEGLETDDVQERAEGASLLNSVLDGECVPKAAVDLDSHCQVSVCNL
jgi:hypothetical protein